MNPLKLLPVDEFKVLKVIQIQGPKWNWFFGYLPYLRTFKFGEYDSEKGDEIDEKILSIIRVDHPDSILRFNSNIFFEGELEETLKNIEGRTRKDIIIQFYPLIPFEEAPQLVGTEFYTYPYTFQLRLHCSPENDKLQYIHDYYICNLPYKSIDESVKTIRPI